MIEQPIESMNGKTQNPKRGTSGSRSPGLSSLNADTLSSSPPRFNEVRFSTIAEALADLRRGKPVIVVDNEDRENEGDLVVAAEFADAGLINFMATHARGLICVPMLAEDLDRLEIPMMITKRDGRVHTSPFTVSVEAACGVTTGISAADRAETIRILAARGTAPADITMPGHVFPLRAHPDGLRGRHGHTEASVTLMQHAGLAPAAVICEIMNEDGTMARRTQLAMFAQRHDLKMITISDLEQYTRLGEPTAETTDRSPWIRTAGGGGLLRRTESADLPTRYGVFRVSAFVDDRGLEHLALQYGSNVRHPVDVASTDADAEATGNGRQADVLVAAALADAAGIWNADSSKLSDEVSAPLVRIHSECLTGDALGSVRCDCGDQLDAALAMIADEGSGVLLYLRQEGRGIGLANKIRAYTLQDRGLDTVEANQCLGFEPDARDYSIATDMLKSFGIDRLRLLTNNPRKVEALEQGGIEITQRVPLTVTREENSRYLRTKAEKLGHVLGD